MLGILTTKVEEPLSYFLPGQLPQILEATGRSVVPSRCSVQQRAVSGPHAQLRNLSVETV